MNKVVFALVAISTLLLVKLAFQSENPQNLGHKFTIFRDELNIPHVYAYSKKELYFGMGYAQGQDRQWTIYLRKMILEGRLSQLFGREALPLDLYTRNINFKKVGAMNAKLLDPETRDNLQSFADGINSHARNSKMLPFEFYLFWLKWEDWTIENTISMISFLSFTLEFDWMYELARQRLLETVGPDLAKKILVYGSDQLFRDVTIISEDELKKMNQFRPYNLTRQKEVLNEHWIKKNLTLGSINLPSSEYEGSGSNAWGVSGQHSAKGKPILANDPHLGLVSPSLFYPMEATILDQHNDSVVQIFGTMIDGSPFFSIGVNKKFAWGSTAAYIDIKDVFYETTRVHDKMFQYQYKDQWHNFTLRNEKFKIRGEGEYNQVYFENHRGPVIKSVFMDVQWKYGFPFPENYQQNHTVTLNSAIYVPDGTSSWALGQVGFTNDYEKFKNTSQSINAPNIDSIYIDDTGRMGYAAVGRIPKRDIPEMGSFIKDGTSDIYDVKGFLAPDEKLRCQNPEKGYIFMANNKFAPDTYAQRSSLHEISTGRSFRLKKIFQEKIQQKHKFTLEDFMQMQLDQKDEFLSEAFPGLLGRLAKESSIWASEKANVIYNLMLKWDYHCGKESIEASMYHVWERLFQRQLFYNVGLNQEEREAIINHAFFETYQFNLFEKLTTDEVGEEERKICLNSRTQPFSKVHPCLVLAALALKDLPQELEKEFNSADIKEYQWGKLHPATFKSVPFSDIPILKNIWGLSTPKGGNSRTLDVSVLTHQVKSYKSIAGPVFRMVSDVDETYFDYDTGTSDRVYSKYYSNFLGKDKFHKYIRRNPFKETVHWTKTVDTISSVEAQTVATQ